MSLMTVEPDDTEDDAAHIIRDEGRPTASSSRDSRGLLLPPSVPNSV